MEPLQPWCFKFLANQMVKLGEDFIVRTIKDQCVSDKEDKENAQFIFEMDALMEVCRKLGFETTYTDLEDTKTWMDYKEITIRPPGYMQKLRSKIFIDANALVRQLVDYKKINYKKNILSYG